MNSPVIGANGGTIATVSGTGSVRGRDSDVSNTVHPLSMIGPRADIPGQDGGAVTNDNTDSVNNVTVQV